MNKGIYCQLKDFEITVIRLLFTTAENKLRPPTVTQARIIEYLFENKGKDIFQKDIEKTLNLTRATVSEVLTTMESKGLIKREKNPYDSRSKKIVLSKLDIKRQEKLKEKITNIENIITKNISEEELLAFSLTLKKMQENIKNKYNKQGGLND